MHANYKSGCKLTQIYTIFQTIVILFFSGKVLYFWGVNPKLAALTYPLSQFMFCLSVCKMVCVFMNLLAFK